MYPIIRRKRRPLILADVPPVVAGPVQPVAEMPPVETVPAATASEQPKTPDAETSSQHESE